VALDVGEAGVDGGKHGRWQLGGIEPQPRADARGREALQTGLVHFRPAMRQAMLLQSRRPAQLTCPSMSTLMIELDRLISTTRSSISG
jgi:hypothetical protein